MSADPKEVAFQQTSSTNGPGAGSSAMHLNTTVSGALHLRLPRLRQTTDEDLGEVPKAVPEQPRAGLHREAHSPAHKADPQATDKSLRTFGTLGVLRHEIRDKSASFKLCQFKPEHGLNPETQAMYDGNILRVVPELVYSPHATKAQLAETGTKAKAWRIDLVLFLNGIPIVTMELKSEFKQSVDRAE